MITNLTLISDFDPRAELAWMFILCTVPGPYPSITTPKLP